MSTTRYESQIRRAYRLLSPVYDRAFDWILRGGRQTALRCAEVRPEEKVLEVGVGTGLSFGHYPRDTELVGIDLSPEMLARAQERAAELGLDNVTVRLMDATRMDFPDDTFDKAIATYAVSAAPRPAAVLREMRRVVKPGGAFVVLNHFRATGALMGTFEDLVAPLCRRLGWKSNLALEPLLAETELRPDLVRPVNLFPRWHLLRFTKTADARDPDGRGDADGGRSAAGAATRCG